MSHRIIISSLLKSVFQQEDVITAAANTLSSAHCSKIWHICNTLGEPSDEDFRFLIRKLNQLYCTED